MNKEVTIRQATIADIKGIQRLNHALFIKEYRDYDKTLNTKYTYSKKGKDYFRWRVINHHDGIIVVAEFNSRIIGYLAGGLLERKPSRLPARYAELENMLVESKFRSKGVGSKLIKYFFSWCEQKKINFVKVTASSQNFRAQKLYHKIGFDDYDVVFLKKMRLK